VAVDTQPRIVDRCDLLDRIDAGEDVAQVAVAEVTDVGARERSPWP
jgi:hypothetical protein